jgi:iron complex transport system substrate-binding protein
MNSNAPLILLLLTSCRLPGEPLTFRYTSAPKVEDHGNFKLLTLRPGGQRWVFSYVLLQRGTPTPAGYPGVPVVEIPVQTFGISTNIGLQQHLETLGIDDRLVCISSLRGVFANMPRIRRAVKEGRVKEVDGVPEKLESLVSVHPQVLFSDFVGASSGVFFAQRVGITGIPIGNRSEKTPLASAEWIKVIALFFNREREANELFDGIASRYEDLLRRVQASNTKPAALPARGLGLWEERYLDRKLIGDAGGELVPERHSYRRYYETYPYELVLDRGYDADVWPYADPSWKRVQKLIDADSRLAKFRAVRDGRVYGIGSPPTPGVMNDYYAATHAFPDRVLADLVAILHPEVLPGHALRYFRLLPRN